MEDSRGKRRKGEERGFRKLYSTLMKYHLCSPLLLLNVLILELFHVLTFGTCTVVTLRQLSVSKLTTFPDPFMSNFMCK